MNGPRIAFTWTFNPSVGPALGCALDLAGESYDFGNTYTAPAWFQVAGWLDSGVVPCRFGPSSALAAPVDVPVGDGVWDLELRWDADQGVAGSLGYGYGVELWVNAARLATFHSPSSAYGLWLPQRLTGLEWMHDRGSFWAGWREWPAPSDPDYIALSGFALGGWEHGEPYRDPYQTYTETGPLLPEPAGAALSPPVCARPYTARTGAQFLRRWDGGERPGLYAREHPDAAWARPASPGGPVAPLWGIDEDLYGGTSGHSLDFGQSWFANTNSGPLHDSSLPRPALATGFLVTDAVQPGPDGGGACVGYSYETTGEAIRFRRLKPGPADVVVASGLRTASDIRDAPFPQLWRDGAGRWHVYAFLGGLFRSWVSTDTTGNAWVADETLSASDPFALFSSWQLLRLRSGQELAVGHAHDPDEVEDSAVNVFWRAGPGAQWEGPYLNEALALATAPYAVELPDGRVEAGWLASGVWQRRRTRDVPGDVWEVPDA